MKKARNYSDEDEEEFSTRLAEDLTFQKYESKSKVLRHRHNDLYESGSDVDSEGKINTNGDSSIESNGFQTSLSRYAEEHFDKSFNSAIHSEYNTLDVAERSMERLKGAQLQRISDNVRDDVNVGSTEIPQQFSNSNKMSLDKQFLDSNGIDDFLTDIKREDCTKEEGRKILEDQPVYVDMSHDKIYHDIDNTNEKMETLTSSKRKTVEKDSQQVYEKEAAINRSDGSSQPVDNLEKEYLGTEEKEIASTMYHDSGETSNKNISIRTQNKLNVSLEDVDKSFNVSPQTEQSNKSEMKEVIQTSDKKTINYNKEKLLATMKAIDDNENIEFLNQRIKNANVNRMQIMENLHRGLPAHSKPKRDIIRDIFEDNHIESKVRSTCSKSH